MLTEMERDHQKFRTELTDGLESLLTRRLPTAVKAEMDKIEAQKALQEQQDQAERDAKVQRYKNRISLIGSIFILLTALVTFFFAFQGETDNREVKHMNSVSDAITGFQ